MATGVRTLFLPGGLLPEDPFVETYLVKPGGATVFDVAPAALPRSDSSPSMYRPRRRSMPEWRTAASTTLERSQAMIQPTMRTMIAPTT
jgi:hypothetical protein